MRPSVETYANVMRRLGAAESLEDDVSTADDMSRKGSVSGRILS